VHTEHESNPWTISVGDHAARTDSPEYLAARKLMIELVKLCQPWFMGDPPYQDHHGGGLWVVLSGKPLMVLGKVGCEWSAQFCGDPAKFDRWRQDVKTIVDSFPETIPFYEKLGYPAGRAAELLNTPIADAQGIAVWVDSIFNASVPIPADRHTGVLGGKIDGGQSAGYHHYPKPIVDIELLKRDDFTLYVTDAQGQPAAVVPVAAHGSGAASVAVVYATPGTDLHKRHAAAHAAGKQEILHPEDAMAQQAFAKQQPSAVTPPDPTPPAVVPPAP